MPTTPQALNTARPVAPQRCRPGRPPRPLIARAASCLLVLGAATAVLPAAAAEVSVGVRTSAIDAPGGFNAVINEAGGQAGPVYGTLPLLSFTRTASAGIVNSVSFAQANAYTGRLGGTLFVDVADTIERPGRGGSATAITSMTGSITITGSGAPGLATFSGVVEGAYNYGTADQRWRNRTTIEANGIIGDQYRELPLVTFEPNTGAGLFAFPLTWTVAVQPGQVLQMSFYLRAFAQGTLGTTELDFSNTFKLTSITLPAGYGFTPDAGGFLSQWVATPVPEPTSAALLAAGIAALAWRRRALHRACAHSSERLARV